MQNHNTIFHLYGQTNGGTASYFLSMSVGAIYGVMLFGSSEQCQQMSKLHPPAIPTLCNM